MLQIRRLFANLFRPQAPKELTREEKLNGELAKLWSEMPIHYLVQATETFVVFLDRFLDVDWSTNNQHEVKDQKRHNEILNAAAVLETTPCEGLPSNMKLHFKRLIGEALARGFDNDFAGAKVMLKSAEKYVISRSEETSRRWYLSASFFATTPFIGIGIIAWVWRGYLLTILTPPVFWLLFAMTAGALGSLLSVITRAGKQKLDCSAGRRLHYLEGTSRIIAGAISSLMISMAVRAGLVFSTLISSHHTIAVMLTLAFASGSTERLAPHLVSDLGAKANGDRKSVKDDTAE